MKGRLNRLEARRVLNYIVNIFIILPPQKRREKNQALLTDVSPIIRTVRREFVNKTTFPSL